MKNLSALLNLKFMDAIAKVTSCDVAKFVEVTPSTNNKFGHYQCNSAMRLVKVLNKKPRDIAEDIVSTFDLSNDELIDKLEIAGPGFINITLRIKVLNRYLTDMLKAKDLAVKNDDYLGKRIIVDYSSPNIAKEMHVGHLRSTIIGDSIANLFELLGADLVRLNHVGDWGTAFGMLIVHMLEVAKPVLSGSEEASLSQLMQWYKEAKQRFDDDEDFKLKSQQQVVALQSGDESSLTAWKIICELSKKAFDEIYNLLGVNIEVRGESFYNPYLQEVTQELESSGVAVRSDGALCIFNKGFKNREGNALPFIIKKADGGYNYSTTDMAAIRQRINEEKADKIIYVTDSGQSEHFKMLFASAKAAGYLNDNTEVSHVGFGLVLGEDKKKFKTRSGHTEKLIDLLDTAIVKARSTILDREPNNFTEEEITELGKTIGIGAVKYADLCNNRLSDYVFSYTKMLKFEGNTIIYLLYSYVRVAGIKRKLGLDDTVVKKLIDDNTLLLSEESEIELALHLCRYHEALNRFAKDLSPNKLCEYLYELANKFNAFFRDCKVHGSDEQDSRIVLCEAVAKVMQQGMKILGLKVVDKM